MRRLTGSPTKFFQHSNSSITDIAWTALLRNTARRRCGSLSDCGAEYKYMYIPSHVNNDAAGSLENDSREIISDAAARQCWTMQNRVAVIDSSHDDAACQR